jgi:site-specific DNA-cytosine methylase
VGDMCSSGLTFATDCTGIDAPLHCLKGITCEEIRYLFASDISAKVRSFLGTVRPKPETIFADIHDRIDNSKYHGVDLYIAGFPCQSFSTLGKRKGLGSVHGAVFWRILAFLKEAEPRVFVLENVGKLLTHERGATFATIMGQLQRLRCYHVTFRTMCPLDVGFPQSRPRVFIVGTHTAKTRGGFAWPELDDTRRVLLESLLLTRRDAVALQPSCARPLCATATRNMQVLRQTVDLERLFVVDLGTSLAFACKPKPGCCPCLKRYNQMFYISTQRRYLTFRECLRLQGFSDEVFESTIFKTDRSTSNRLSLTDIHQLAGNTMCIPILRVILQSVLQLILKT